MRYKGKIAQWKDEQGFGFIQPLLGGEQVFVHIKAFTNKGRRPVENDIVTYALSKDKDKVCADAVVFSGEKLSKTRKPSKGRLPLTMITVFFGLLALFSFSEQLPITVLWFYAGLSTMCFILYAMDKSAATNNRWRTKESTLHLVALLGGWPGALLAQRWLRHKSSKKSFLVIFWFSVVANCLGLLCFYLLYRSNGLAQYLS